MNETLAPNPNQATAAQPLPVTALSEDQTVALFKRHGEPAFRATQLREFVFRRGVASYDGVTNLSKALRARLMELAPLYELEPAGQSEGDDATKWLWKARDGALIESVRIRTPDRVT